MKRIILSLLMLLVAGTMTAQTINQNMSAEDARLKYRVYAGGSLVSLLHMQLIDIGSEGAALNGMAGFEYFNTPKVSFGLSSYLGIVAITNIPYATFQGTGYYDAGVAHFSILGTLNYSWLEQGKHRIYSGLGLGFVNFGVNATDGVDSETVSIPGSFGYQLNLIGAETTYGKHFGLWTELGIGIQGNVKFGLSWKF